MEKKNVYAMIDVNERIGNDIWVVTTDCPTDKMQELIGLSHCLGCEEVDSYKGIDLSECWCDSDYLEELVRQNGYEFDSQVIEVLEW